MQKNWQGYITALGNQKAPASTVDTAPYSNTEGGPSTGFVQWKPKDTLKKYDAMNTGWLGAEASELAANKMFKPENASAK